MGETAIVLLILAFYYVHKAFSSVDTKILQLEQKVREFDVKLRYGDLWAEGSNLETAKDEVRLCEEQLAKAELKWFGKDGAVAYAQQRLEEAKELRRDVLKEYEEARKRIKRNKT